MVHLVHMIRDMHASGIKHLVHMLSALLYTIYSKRYVEQVIRYQVRVQYIVQSNEYEIVTSRISC